MVNEVTTIDTNNYAVMAKAMGMSGETSSSDDKPKTLPRFRINHSPIIGSDKVLVKGGTYKLEIPDETTLYGTSTIRPFIQRFMYKRFVRNMSAKAGEPLGVYHKTIMSDNLNVDLKDNQESLIVVSLQVILKTLRHCLWKHRMLSDKSKEFVLYLAQ